MLPLSPRLAASLQASRRHSDSRQLMGKEKKWRTAPTTTLDPGKKPALL